MACRCYWDSDTDNYAKYLFTNVSIIQTQTTDYIRLKYSNM